MSWQTLPVPFRVWNDGANTPLLEEFPLGVEMVRQGCGVSDAQVVLIGTAPDGGHGWMVWAAWKTWMLWA